VAGGLALSIPSRALALAPEATESTTSSPAPVFPRLTIAVHGLIGHYAHGETACQLGVDVALCKDTGRFLGLGGDLDLRVSLWRWIGLNVRLSSLGQVLKDSPYDGLLAPAAGLGVYSDAAFIRVEYLHMVPLGDGLFTAAGTSQRVEETWRAPAGALSGGARIGLGHERWRAEIIAGVVLGPKRVRTYPQTKNEDDFVISFQLGVGASFDLIRKPTRKSARKPDP
jgi:hypothetical protein